MWLSTLEMGAAQLRSVTKIAPKSPLLYVNRNPAYRVSFSSAGAKATRYRVNMAVNSSIWVAVTNSFVGGDVRLTELSVNLFTPKESKVKSTIFHFVKCWMKQIVLRKSAVKELSFEWSHHEILSTDWKVRTTRLHYSLWRVKALKQSWLAI